MNELQRLQQNLYDIVCIADNIRTNEQVTEAVAKQIESIVDLADIHNEFK